MSLYKDATLAMIPTAYKDGKLYSVRPTDGSGDFTFSRGTTATRVASSGYIEKGRENLLLQSNQFDTTWVSGSSTLTSGQSGYDGSSDAWLLTKTAASGNIYQGKSYSGLNTFSIYAKGNTTDWIRLRNTGGYVYFDVTNGVVGGNISAISPSITSVGGGWYRCEVAWNGTGTITQVFVADSDGSTSGTSGSVYIQDAQLEAGLVATDYIETTTTSVSAGILEDMPRLDYSGGASCPALLLEPQRTNLIVQSEGFATTAWTDNATNANVTANATRSPEGVQNAAEIEFTSSSAKIYDQFTNVASSLHIGSVWLKNKNIGSIRVRIEGGAPSILGRVDVNLANGTLSNAVGDFTPTIEDYGDGWYRVAVGDTSNATIATPSFNLDYLSSTGSFYAYGAQVEVGSYPTSYIPTYGASVTRSKDFFVMNLITNGITTSSQTQATLFVEFEKPNTGENVDLMRLRGSGTLGRAFIYNTAAGFASDWGSSQQLNIGGGDNNKVAWRLNSLTDGTDFINGTKGIGSSGTAWSDIRELRFNAEGLGGVLRIKQIALFPTALTDSECIALTTL